MAVRWAATKMVPFCTDNYIHLNKIFLFRRLFDSVDIRELHITRVLTSDIVPITYSFLLLARCVYYLWERLGNIYNTGVYNELIALYICSSLFSRTNYNGCKFEGFFFASCFYFFSELIFKACYELMLKCTLWNEVFRQLISKD